MLIEAVAWRLLEAAVIAPEGASLVIGGVLTLLLLAAVAWRFRRLRRLVGQMAKGATLVVLFGNHLMHLPSV